VIGVRSGDPNDGSGDPATSLSEALPGLNRLSPHEMALLWPERLGWPQSIGALVFFRANQRSSAGELAGELSERIWDRMDALPRFGDRLSWPQSWSGAAYWTATQADPMMQIKVVTLPEPGDEISLLAICAELHSRPIDLARPLWQAWFLDGLADGRVALLLRIHHVLADGVGALRSLTSIFDNAGGSPAPGRPTDATGEVKGWQRTDRWLGLRRAWPALRGVVGDGPAARTSFNRPLGPSRRLGLLRYDLDAVRAVAHRHGATVNDVLLSALGPGLRAVLVSRGEPVAGVKLRAMVPMAKGPEGHRTLNATAGMVVRIPIDERDPDERLRQVAAETAVRRAQPLKFAESGILQSQLLVRFGTRIAARQRVSNLYVANLPGPATRLFLAGRSVDEVFPLVSLLGNVTLGVAVLSYAGQLGIAVIVDAASWPDLDVLLQGIVVGFAELGCSP
jgi:diacylglycerol O-acyltransferase / wax synthase